jgi:hypothetical protein
MTRVASPSRQVSLVVVTPFTPEFEKFSSGSSGPKTFDASGTSKQSCSSASSSSPKRTSPKPPLKNDHTSSIWSPEVWPSSSMRAPTVSPLSSVVLPVKCTSTSCLKT